MQEVTIIITIIASVLVLLLRPEHALGVYVMSVLLYPSYLVLKLGVCDISVGRIVCTVLLLRCFAGTFTKCFSWSYIDTLVSVFISLSFIMPLLVYHQPKMQVLENVLGTILMDLYFPYLVARFCISNQEKLMKFTKLVGIAVVIPLSILGLIEAISGWQPFMAFRQFRPWELPGDGFMPARFGLERAVGPFAHPIMFGTSVGMLSLFTYTLRHEHGKWGKWAFIISTIGVFGVLSSLSSGPVLFLISLIFCLLLEHRKQTVRPLIPFSIVSCIAIELISDRHFYHVIVTRMNPLGGTGWHRAKLIDLAIENFEQWWLVGYHGIDPGWGPSLGNSWTDITNQYILIGVSIGGFGIICFCTMLFCMIRRLIKTYHFSYDPTIKSWCWAFSSLLVSLMITFNSCTLFDQTRSLFYCILGVIASFVNFNSNPVSLQNNIPIKKPKNRNYRSACV